MQEHKTIADAMDIADDYMFEIAHALRDAVNNKEFSNDYEYIHATKALQCICKARAEMEQASEHMRKSRVLKHPLTEWPE